MKYPQACNPVACRTNFSVKGEGVVKMQERGEIDRQTACYDYWIG